MPGRERCGGMRARLLTILIYCSAALRAGCANAADNTNVKSASPATETRQYLNSLLGTVLNDQGQPVIDALVYVRPIEMLRQENRGQSWKTDRHGRFGITGLAPGTVTLGVVTPGTYKRDEYTANTDCIDFVARLRRLEHAGAEYRVTVVDEDGRPQPGARVRLLAKEFSRAEAFALTTETRTNEQGLAVFQVRPDLKDIYNGLGHLVLDQEGCDLAIKFIALTRDENVKFIARKSGQHWRGRVVDQAGAPLAGARVRVCTWDGAGEVHSADLYSLGLLDYTFLTDRDGRFELGRFSVKDRVTVKISLPLHCPVEGRFDPELGCYSLGEKPPRPPAGLPRKTSTNEGLFRLAAGGDIRGQVLDKKTGKPFTRGGRIDIEGMLPRIQTRAPIDRWTRVAPRRNVRLRRAAPLRAGVRARRPDPGGAGANPVRVPRLADQVFAG